MDSSFWAGAGNAEPQLGVRTRCLAKLGLGGPGFRVLLPKELHFDERRAAWGSPMFSLNPYNIIAGLIFGVIGMGALSYGRKLELWKPQVIGLVMMGYSYFFSNAWLLWLVGVGLLVTLWYHHDE